MMQGMVAVRRCSYVHERMSALFNIIPTKWWCWYFLQLVKMDP